MTEQPVHEEAVCRKCDDRGFYEWFNNHIGERDEAPCPDCAVPKGEQAARAYVTDADGARPLVVEPDSPLGRAWEGDETFTEAAGESRVEAAWVEFSRTHGLFGSVQPDDSCRIAIEAAVADKARQERDEEWARDCEVKGNAEAENLNDWITACHAAEAARDQLAEALRKIAAHIARAALASTESGEKSS